MHQIRSTDVDACPLSTLLPAAILHLTGGVMWCPRLAICGDQLCPTRVALLSPHSSRRMPGAIFDQRRSGSYTASYAAPQPGNADLDIEHRRLPIMKMTDQSLSICTSLFGSKTHTRSTLYTVRMTNTSCAMRQLQKQRRRPAYQKALQTNQIDEFPRLRCGRYGEC